MKKLILACIFFFGLSQTHTANAQLGQAALVQYFNWYYAGNNSLIIVNIPGGCACQVQVTVTVDGVTSTIIYAPNDVLNNSNPDYPAYQAYVDNLFNNATGNGNTGTGGVGDGDNQQSVEFNIWFSLWVASNTAQAQAAIDRAEYQAMYNEYVFMQEASGNNVSNVSCYGGTGETWEFSFTEAYVAAPDAGSPDATLGAAPGGCPVQYLVGTQVVAFANSGSLQPDSLLFNTNGSEVTGVKINGTTYRAAIQYDVTIAANIRAGALNCSDGHSSTWADTIHKTIFHRPRPIPHFVNFGAFVGPPPFGANAISGQLGVNGPPITGWQNIPPNMTNVSFTLDSTQSRGAVAGDRVRLARLDSFGHVVGYYCITLKGEDVKRGLDKDRNTKYIPPTLHLQYPVNVPDWAQELLDLIPALYLGECAINHANAGLDKLHESASYQALQTDDEKRNAEYKSLAYDLVFGYMYCRTNEAAARNESCAAQVAMGVMNELIAAIDVVQMKEGIVQLANGLGSMVSDNIQNILDAIENASRQEKTQDSLNHDGFNIERFVKSFGDSTVAGLDSIQSKLSGMAHHFKEMYFTGCHATTVAGYAGTYDLCCYRKGQLTMMAVPIILTAGEYAVMKLTNLAAKYGSRAKAAIELMNAAENAGKIVTTELDVVMNTEKIVVREADNSISSTIKKEEDIPEGSLTPDKQIVITERASLMDNATLNGLTPELPNLYNISKTKFHSSAHKIDPAVDAELQQKVSDIIANGDNLGTKTEAIQDKLFRGEGGYSVLDGKYGTNNGIDGLYIKGTVDNPTEIVVCEAKQWNSGSGGVTLSQQNLSTGLPTQMSDNWIEYVAGKLIATGDAQKISIGNMLLNAPTNSIKKYVTTVNKSTGDINILALGIF